MWYGVFLVEIAPFSVMHAYSSHIASHPFAPCHCCLHRRFAYLNPPHAYNHQIIPPAKRPKRPIAPNPVPTVSLPAAPVVAAGLEDVVVPVAPPGLVVLPLVDVAALLLLEAVEDESAFAFTSSITPPLTEGWLSSSSTPSVFSAAALYCARVLSLGLQRGQ